MNDAQRRRKQLLEQMRNTYDDRRTLPAVHPRYGTAYQKLYGDDEEFTSGTLGIRAFICVMIFICFTFLDQKETQIMNISSEKIANEIHASFDINGLWENL